jgi:hypothetical protein
MPAALGAPALPGAQQDAQPREQGPGRPLGGVQGLRNRCYQAVSPALARLLRDEIVATYGQDLPSAVACLQEDFEACVAHLKFPLASSPRHPNHQSARAAIRRGTRRSSDPACLRRARRAQAAERWRGLEVTAFERHQLQAIHDDLNEVHASKTAPAVATTNTPAFPNSFIQQDSDLTGARMHHPWIFSILS